jgi:hypothetical protein
MSFFRPHKSKPRQFNYIPRHFDPVKEERELRRKELHGTSTEDDYEEYVPGKYIRTQREARDIARENEANSSTISKMRNMLIIGAVIVVFALFIVPRFIDFAKLVQDEKERQAQAKAEEERIKGVIEYYEGKEGIDDGEELMKSLEAKEAWQRSTTIIDNDGLIERQRYYQEVIEIIDTEMADMDQNVRQAIIDQAYEDPKRWLEMWHANGK